MHYKKYRLQWSGRDPSPAIAYRSEKAAWDSLRTLFTQFKYATLWVEAELRIPVLGTEAKLTTGILYWKPVCHGTIRDSYDLLTVPGGDLAWDCEKSPDGKCHYFTNSNGLVQLYNGDEVAPPRLHDPEYETEDSCIFCGEPEERK